MHGDAGLQQTQSIKVATVQRQSGNFLLITQPSQRAAGCLHEWCLSFHRDRFGNSSNRERKVLHGLLSDGDRESLLRLGREGGDFGLHIIVADGKRWNGEAAIAARLSRPYHSGLPI